MKRKSLLLLWLLAMILAPRWVYAQDVQDRSSDQIEETEMVSQDYDDPGPLRATTVKMGADGADNALPFNNYYHYSWNQMIYTAEELGGAQTISKISFLIGGVPSTNYTATNLRVYLGHTSLGGSTGETDLTSSSWVPASSLTQVYSSSSYTPTTATTYTDYAQNWWITITLSTSFSYNGTDNLAIVISDANSTYESGLKFKYITDQHYLCLYRRNDSSSSYADHPGSNTGSTTKNRPILKLTDYYTEGDVINIKKTSVTPGTEYTFVDEGGDGGDCDNSNATNNYYTLYARFRHVFTGPVGSTIRAAFSAFCTESSWDYLYIYNGNNTSGTQLASLTGSPSLNTYSSTSNSMTFKFREDSSGNRAGWNATVTAYVPPVDVEVGTNESTAYGGYLPVDFFYNNSLTQQIYTPEEIGYTGTIDKLSFYYSTGTSETRTITIYMKMTSTKILSSFDSSPGTVVYNSSYTFSGTGWQTIPLSTTFNYSNIAQNLMITVDMNGTYSSTRYFATYDTGENRALYAYDDNTNYDATNPPSDPDGISQYNNYIKFQMQNSTQYRFVIATVNGVGSISYSPSGTTTPKGHRAYTTGTSVTLTASAGNMFSFTNWTEGSTVVSSSASYNFTISANRNLVANFTETPATIPYTETFESNTWPMVNGDRTNKWYRGVAGARNGSNGLFISSDGSNNTYNVDANGLVWAYRTINFDEATYYAISFDWRAVGESGYDYMRVGLVPASTTLTDTNGDSFSAPTGWIDLNNSNELSLQTAWQRKTTVINVSAGNYKLAFCWRNDGSVGNDPPAAIDNVEVRKAYSINVSASSGGSVSGSGYYGSNQRCTVTATPNSNYCFVNWTESGTQVSTSSTYTFDVTANRTLVANFVSLNASSITVSGNTTNCGSTATLTASGMDGFVYNWYSDASCTNLVTTGSSFTTPVLTNDAIYYVKAVKSSTSEQVSNFSYTGGSQSYSIPSGASSLKMEVWGAQGGGRQVDGNSNGGYGGNGGYSVGTLENLSGVSSVYVYVGGQGQTSMRQDEAAAPGGWNGGGTAFASSLYDPACGGGGATDIRVNGTDLYYRIIVAGGGGGGGEDAEQGGYGGGTTGGTGSSSSATGGTQTGGGTGSAFGIGASTQYDGGAGGGGWYGGGCGGGSQTIPTENSGSDSNGGAGGSGYVWSSSTASSAPSGYAVSSSYYLTSAQTIAGNASMPNPAGGTMTGNQSNGYARITAYFEEECETGVKTVTVTVNQPDAPTNLQVSNITTTTATVSWSGTTGSYEYSINNGSTWIPTNSTSVNLTGLTPGTTYTFQVRSYSGDCYSEAVSEEFTTESTHLVEVTVGEGGYYSGGGLFNHGESCTLTATPADGYTFTGWYENNSLVSTDNPYTFEVLADHSFEARFSLNYYTITVSANPAEGGTVSQNVPSGSYQYSQNCILTAIPNTGWTFVNWTENGSPISTSNPLEFYATADRTLVANFVYTFTKEITGHQGGNGNWYLITSPLNDPIAPTAVTNMVAATAENYDLFSFKQDAPVDPETGLGLEWINYKETAENGGGFGLEAGKGYLYANYNTVQLQFTGVPYQDNGAGCVSVYLTHTTGYNWSDWNLVGNPYNGNAYLDGPFYKMNPEGTEIVAVENSDLDAVIGPMEGVFVKYDDAEGYVAATFSTASGAKVASLALNVTKDRGLVDRAYLSFGGKHSLPKFQLNPSHTKVYIPKDDKDYAVAIAESDMGELPVNFKAEKNGTYTIGVNAQEVRFGYLHLIDNKTGADVDLLDTPSYTFEALSTDYASRFKLVFATGNATDDSFAFYSNGGFVISNDGDATLQVMDVTGRIVKSETLHGCANVSVNAAPGVYMLRLINGENERVQKIVVR